jgi:hypothetical protein
VNEEFHSVKLYYFKKKWHFNFYICL